MNDATIDAVGVRAYRVPTEGRESDGTLEWDSTVLVLVEIRGGGLTGIGYTYASRAAAVLIGDKLPALLQGRDALDVPALWQAMLDALRNIGRPGAASMAVSACDIALWDLKARLLGQPLIKLLGQVRNEIPVYASGGFTSYSIEEVCAQLAGWAENGIGRVKMKVGREPDKDVERVEAARRSLPAATELFVDANGAYHRRQALAMARAFGEAGVTWYEEPVSSDDLEGLAWLRGRCPAPMAVTAGEYGFDVHDFRRMLEAQAVDCIMPDVTRCQGITGYLQVGSLANAFHTPVSSHCAPALAAQLGCAVRMQEHLEYFYDHARIENRLFDGVPRLESGCLAPDLTRPGLGLEFKYQDAADYEI